jgi:myo-inositol-1(or 4)-monophosphatase
MKLQNALKQAKEAALEAGKRLVHYYHYTYQLTHKDQEKEQPLTSADTEANEILESYLREPSYGWLSEESLEDLSRLDKEWVWIIDPMDGTKEFIHHVPEFGVSIGLVQNGVPRLGVFYNPIREELFWGCQGEGVFLGEERVFLKKPPSTLSQAQVLISRSEHQKKKFEKFLPTDFEQIPWGSVAYKLALVSAGKADATFTLQPRNEWDIAAGAFFLQENGAYFKDSLGKSLLFNKKNTLKSGLIASVPALSQSLISCIQERTPPIS